MAGLLLDPGSSGTSYSIGAGGFVASNAYAVSEHAFERYHHDPVEPTEGAISVAEDVVLPADAEIDSAVFNLTARSAGVSSLAGIADVRSASPSSDASSALVLDFGRMVTVAGVSSPFATVGVSRWGGDAFHPVGLSFDDTFEEVTTDRLLLQFGEAVDEAAFRGGGGVALPAVPTGLELLVNGTTVWFERQGSSPVPPGPTPDAGVAYTVDRTDAIRDAFAKTPGGPVRVELRAATPGLLTLEPIIDHRRVHPVAFPDGPSRSLDLPSEGPFTLELPLPGESSTWSVDEVRMVVRGGAGDDRVQPADGPPLAVEDAELVISAGRVLLARLPSGLLGRFLSLGAIRLPLSAPDQAGELTGRLLGDADGRPGEPVDGGDLSSVRVEVGAAPQWTTLSLPAPIPLDGAVVWLEIHVSYGEVQWAMTRNPPEDPAAPGAELFRRLPGGGIRAFPVLAELGPLQGAVRVVGRADPNRPIPLLALDVGSGVPLQVTPTGVDVAGAIGLPEPAAPVSNALTLDGLATASGTFTFADVTVRYRESA